MRKQHLSLTGLTDVIALGLALATLLGFLGGLHWSFDLFAHFRVQYMQLCLPLIAITLWRRFNSRALTLFILAAVNYTGVLPLYFVRPAPTDGQPIRAMLMNINAGNGNTELVLGSVEQFSPDVLLLEEVTPKWAHELESLNTIYPYRVEKPQAGCFGIMLLSRYPLEHGQILQIGTAGVPSIAAELHCPQGVISIIGTHALPPVGSEGSRQRNIQLAALPVVIKEQRHPTLLIGDLNTTPWSPHFRQLIRDSGLKNSMKGFGFQPSWPVGVPFMKIPIDHMLHSEEIVIHARGLGPDVGSDHLPVIVDFSIRQ